MDVRRASLISVGVSFLVLLLFVLLLDDCWCVRLLWLLLVEEVCVPLREVVVEVLGEEAATNTTCETNAVVDDVENRFMCDWFLLYSYRYVYENNGWGGQQEVNIQIARRLGYKGV